MAGKIERSGAAMARGMTLPAEFTRFVGRRRELAEVKRLLSSSRLVTLTGIGGVGKTRLSLRAAADLRRAFRDGVYLVELADLQDPALLRHTVAGALGLREQAREWQTSSLVEYLAPRQVLLVLDNCEHLIDGCAALAGELLRGCPQLRILATSRQPFGVSGENILPVPSLAMPDPDGPPPTPKTLEQYEAVTLFVERATAAVPTRDQEKKAGTSPSRRRAARLTSASCPLLQRGSGSPSSRCQSEAVGRPSSSCRLVDPGMLSRGSMSSAAGSFREGTHVPQSDHARPHRLDGGRH